MTTTDTEDICTDEYLVQDGSRQLKFKGCHLASSTSHYPGKDRWIEFELYRTHLGKYVISRIGRTILPNETDRFWANVSDTPVGVVETLYLQDDDGVRYLTRVARDLLDEASTTDSAIAAAYQVEVIE